jgi:hypothetical protein
VPRGARRSDASHAFAIGSPPAVSIRAAQECADSSAVRCPAGAPCCR